MFAAANRIAQQFTRPLIVSFRRVNGTCETGIGAFIVINDEGWFITAFHMIEQLQSMSNSIQQYTQIVAQQKQIQQKVGVNPAERNRILKGLKIPGHLITNNSIWMGFNHWRLNPQMFLNPAIDLAIGKIDGFKKEDISVYPKFMDPSKAMEPGTSLCKLGFPFHVITPTFDDVNQKFELPLGALPVPFFPIEGIFTRTIMVNVANIPNPLPFPLMYIETSSPGLRGQSGGPTFDVHGNIWAMQVKTNHYKLGFGSENMKGTSMEKEHLSNQYLNVGWGVHSATIVNSLKQQGIKFDLSTN